MTMTALTITSWTAIYLTVFYVVISMRVGLNRQKRKLSLGDGGVDDMNRLIRAHANFAEYVPHALILLILCELKAANYQAITIAAVLLCVARTVHYFGMTHNKIPLRVAGMIGTMVTLLILANALLMSLN